MAIGDMRFEDLKGGFFIVAHRGASGYEPENTIRAVRRALDMRVDAVEVDVRLSKDGVPVVMHDETVDRTTDGSGRVDEMTLEELRRLDAGKGERIPLLREVLEEVKGRAVLFVEIKVEEAAIPALSIVEDEGMLDEVLFISFSGDSVRAIKDHNPDAHIGLIYSKPSNGIVEAKGLGCEAVLPFYRLATEKAIAFAHRLKMLVIAWTIDDFQVAKTLKDKGVDGIATNYPDRILPLKRTT
ncbi:MAG: glycerophosphodiester phosphodiesterase [Thermoprotei archaeon]|nr:glycerophosphodiester phosphodiesterase [Thermoprotei archaeon]